jgi:hypothetical protein
MIRLHISVAHGVLTPGEEMKKTTGEDVKMFLRRTYHIKKCFLASSATYGNLQRKHEQ